MTVIDQPEQWPQIGRGGHLRNQKGQALVVPADGGRKQVAVGASDLDVFEGVYSGPPIYGMQGTHVHNITELADNGSQLTQELIDAGLECDIDEAATRDCYTSYLEFVDRLGWVTESIEQVVVCDRWSVPIASNIDKIGRFNGGPLTVVDVKSGNRYAKRAAVLQLAAYVDSFGYNPETGERVELGVSRDVAYLFWYPIRANNRQWELIGVDVNAGRQLLDEFFALRDDTRHLAAFNSVTPLVTSAAPTQPDPQRRAQLLARHAALSDIDKTRVVWPEDRTDLDAVETAIAYVEGFRDIATTPQKRPETAPQAAVSSQTPDEGDQFADDSVGRLEGRYRALDDHQRTWIATLTSQATRAGLSFHMSQAKTVRRYWILAGLMALAEFGDDYVVGCARAAGSSHTGSPGAVVGALHAEQAVMFCDYARALEQGEASVTFTLDGNCEVTLT